MAGPQACPFAPAFRRPLTPPDSQGCNYRSLTKIKHMSCQGKTRNGTGSTHGQCVYKCKNCGAVGCDSNDCTNRNFWGGKCLKCGRSGAGRDRVS